MLVAAIIDDPLGIVLAIGVLVSASSAVVYFAGRPTRRTVTQPTARVGARSEIVSASSALARAQAAALERSTAAASAEGYRLSGVRPARPSQQIALLPGPRTDRARMPPDAAGGQSTTRSDGDGSDRDVATAQARAIAFHIAETDPQRMAEVIRTWIQQDGDRLGGAR